MQCIITEKQSKQNAHTMMKQRKGLRTRRQSELKKPSSFCRVLVLNLFYGGGQSFSKGN